MPELRRDPIVGFWTILSTERSRRPVEFKAEKIAEESACCFCEGHESETTGEVYAVRKNGSKADGPGWDVRVIVSKTPLLSQEGVTDRMGRGIYDFMEGVGKHEILIESPKHKHDLDEFEPTDIERVIKVYAERLNALREDKRFEYGLLFKNHGHLSGSAKDVVPHSRSQLIGLPIIPKRVKEELWGARGYFERQDRCVYCDVLKQEMADGSRTVDQNDSFFAFCPFASRAPFEIWIFPKKHRADFGNIQASEIQALALILKECLTRLHVLLNDPPFNLILHTAPFRRQKNNYQWKTIEEDSHWYFHIQPRLTQSAGFEWGTGIHINPTPPEDAALLLRETDISRKGQHAST